MKARSYKMTCWSSPMGWQARVEFPITLPDLAGGDGPEEAQVSKTFSGDDVVLVLHKALDLLASVASEKEF